MPERFAAAHQSAPLRQRLQQALGDAYLIERELGGGMSRVFAAREAQLDRVVVVKVLPPELGAAVSAERFRREIALAARLQHPHIVPVHAAGEVEGIPYYTMPFIEGQSLRQRLQGGALPPADVVRIMHDVADALAYAHDHGVVHRDIKPDNILLTRGHAVVTDFGVAKALYLAGTSLSRETPPGGSQHTGAGLAIGTPAYMAPEQAAGDPHTDHRADLYALGVVAWEMLAGRALFGRRPAHELLAAQITEQPMPIGEMRDDVPRALDAIVMRCLEKSPGDRPQTAAELRDALEVVIAELSTASGGRPATAHGRSRWPLLGAAAAAVVAIAAGGWFLVPRGPALDENVVAVVPFDVATGSSLGYLREGMLDLIAAKLTGEGGPRSAEPRAVLGEWRRAAGSDTGGLPRERVLALAERLGAGQLLIGDIAGDADSLAISATLVRVRDGRARVTERVAGSGDSLPQLLDRLVGQLLMRAAGEGERMPMLARTPLPALRAYLAGQWAFRRGRYRDAIREYARAVDADSTFTLAAIGLVEATGWVNEESQRVRGARLAWAGRDSLSERDRARLMALVGPRYPYPTPYVEHHAANIRYAQLAPDRPEAQFQVGDGLFHYGRVIGIRDAHAQAQVAFQRALEIDSTFAPALEHLVLLAAKDGDTTTAVRAATRFLQIDRESESADGIRWRIAALRRDRATLDALTPRIGARGGTAVSYVLGVSTFEGVEPALAAHVLDSALARAATSDERVSHALMAHDLAMARGRPREAAEKLRSASAAGLSQVGVLREQVKNALYWDGDTVTATRAAAELARTTPEARLPADSARMPLYLANICVLERWRLAHRDTRTVRRSLASMRGWVAQRGADPGASFATHCMITVEAQLAVIERAPDARQRVARLDSLLLTGPQGSAKDIGNLVVAQLKEQAGDVQGALAAVRRREYVFMRPVYVSTYLREEARLAEATGDVEGAIAAYRQYLSLRSEPEAEMLGDVETVKAELDRLLREGAGK